MRAIRVILSRSESFEGHLIKHNIYVKYSDELLVDKNLCSWRAHKIGHFGEKKLKKYQEIL